MDPGRGPGTDFESILLTSPPLLTPDRFSGVPSNADPLAASKLQLRPRAQGAVSHALGSLLGVLLEPAWEASWALGLLGVLLAFGRLGSRASSCLLPLGSSLALLLFCSIALSGDHLEASWVLGPSGAIWKPSILGCLEASGAMSTPSDAIQQNFWRNLLPLAAAGRRRPIRIEHRVYPPGGGEMGGGNRLTRRVPPRGRRNTLAIPRRGGSLEVRAECCGAFGPWEQVWA